MTTFYMIRHGEPTYAPCDERGFIGHGRDLAPLTARGVRQIEEIATDTRLRNAQVIITSPYTRALQSAAILSKELGLDINVEVDLHEWLPDTSFQYSSAEVLKEILQDYASCNGIHPEGAERLWEAAESMKARVDNVMNQYLNYDFVVVVCHGMVIQTQKCKDRIEHAEIIEITKCSEIK